MSKNPVDAVKKMDLWKKILIVMIVLLSLVRIFYIVFRNDIQRGLLQPSEYDLSNASVVECDDLEMDFKCDHDRLMYIGLIFEDIPEDKSGIINVGITTGDKLLYSSNISVANIIPGQWTHIYVNALTDSSKDYKLHIMSDGCSTTPKVTTVGDGQIAVNYLYLETPGTGEKAFAVVKTIAVALIAAALVIFSDKIYSTVVPLKKKVFGSVRYNLLDLILEIALCAVIAFFSKAGFSMATIGFLGLISVLAVIGYDKKCAFTDKLFTDQKTKAAAIILYVYGAFALTGIKLFIYPLNKEISVVDILVFIAAIFWVIPVTKSLFYYFDKLGKKAFKNSGRLSTVIFVAVILLIILAPLEFNLYINNPGISSEDSISTMIINGKHLQGMDDWHPFFYCFVTNLLLRIKDSTYTIIFSQHILYAFVLTDLILYLRKKGLSDTFLYIVTFLFAFNISNYLPVNTIWKDVPYCLVLLWVFVILSKLVIDGELYKKKWLIYVELAIALSVLALIRKNGFVVFIIIALALIPVIRKNLKIIGSIALSLVMIFIVQVPLRSHYDVKSTGTRGSHIGLGQDILGAYYGEGEVSERTSRLVADITGYNTNDYQYMPTWSDQAYDSKATHAEFIKCYIDTFLRDPVLVTRAVTAREEALWSVCPSDEEALNGACFYTTMDGRELEGYKWNDYYPAREETPLFPVVTNLSLLTHDAQILDIFTWRSAVLTFLGLASIVLLFCRKKGKGLITMISPVIGQIMGLLLSTGWAEFRYYWGINMMNFALILMTLIIINQKKESKEKANV